MASLKDLRGRINSVKSTRKINVNYVNGISTELTYDNPDEDTFLPSKIAT